MNYISIFFQDNSDGFRLPLTLCRGLGKVKLDSDLAPPNSPPPLTNHPLPSQVCPSTLRPHRCFCSCRGPALTAPTPLYLAPQACTLGPAPKPPSQHIETPHLHTPHSHALGPWLALTSGLTALSYPLQYSCLENPMDGEAW